jgi:hypothetical protein
LVFFFSTSIFFIGFLNSKYKKNENKILKRVSAETTITPLLALAEHYWVFGQTRNVAIKTLKMKVKKKSRYISYVLLFVSSAVQIFFAYLL